jgi:hypothetical protein
MIGMPSAASKAAKESSTTRATRAILEPFVS